MRGSKQFYRQNGVFVLTDQKRAANIAQIISLCPKSAKIIIRNHNFDEYSQFITKGNRSKILATINPILARRNKLYGVHIPNKRIKYFHQSARSNLVVTASAHNIGEILRAKNANIKNILVSPVFKSQSPSAKTTLGPIKLALLVRQFSALNFIALGGINKKTIRRLGNIKIGAIAGVSFKIPPLPHEQP